jgi:C-terminal processing protease CtpA/Prc
VTTLPTGLAARTAASGFDPGSPPPASATPREYLSWVLDVLQALALNRERVDWPVVRARAVTAIERAVVTADTYPAIQLVLEALGDRHTVFITPAEIASLGPDDTGTDGPTATAPRFPEGRLIEPGLGYLMLPGTALGPSGYAARGAAALREIDRSMPAGWIVDLRQDGGGATYPMLDAVAPLLGDGLLCSQVGVDFRQEVRLQRGVLTVGGQVVPKDIAPDPLTGAPGIPDYVTHNDYVPHHPRPPVAVLTGELTASAGEAVLAAFLGRPDTRTFGEKTAGLATGNIDFWLGDGALLVVTITATEDRIGRRYDTTPIPPDVLVDFNQAEMTGDPADDPVITAATQWLREQL